ncbi:uncharacterized protein B0I36DRAFT_350898 [Microdochium trichocladiopsis]|uniref:Uncharacterized protein n=1 Tax=Microdochium trichocladiopsis TaxID=1682393 RepID=A0A9P9BN56_9PEZI|nr:uncharacterized protein B0I36DRAFT_350898 [Microdochium trichocladiopsis]KAH7027356.1 hypothetical protein B0I36DRAFT_350898 [Microdochium trichocladiopsis]
MYGNYKPQPGQAPALADPAVDPNLDIYNRRAAQAARFRGSRIPALAPWEASATEWQLECAKKRLEELPKEDWELDLASIPDHCDPRPGQELKALFQNDILEDKENLDGATPAQVREYFNRWRLSLGEDEYTLRRLPRYCTCIMLDDETMDQLDTLPDDIGSLDRLSVSKLPHWVKMIEHETSYTGNIHAPQYTDPLYPYFGEFRIRLFAHQNLFEYTTIRLTVDGLELKNLVQPEDVFNPTPMRYFQ